MARRSCGCGSRVAKPVSTIAPTSPVTLRGVTFSRSAIVRWVAGPL